MMKRLFMAAFFIFMTNAGCIQIPPELMDYTITQSDELIYSVDESDRTVIVSANYILEKVANGQEDKGN